MTHILENPQSWPGRHRPARSSSAAHAGSLRSGEDHPPRQRMGGRSCEGGRVLEAAVAILVQGEDLLRALPVEVYTRRVPLAFNASIGGHYRHCLDHFTSLLRGLDSDLIDYDHRERDARLETIPEFALAATRQIRSALGRVSVDALDREVRAQCEVSYDHGDSSATGSTVGRELVYAIAHAIHHYALISVIARLMDAKLPDHFGVAPSTVAHLNSRGAGNEQVGRGAVLGA